MLAADGAGQEEPEQSVLLREASSAHETACTLRDTGDLPDGAIRHLFDYGIGCVLTLRDRLSVHLTDPNDLNLGARPVRDNPQWPAVGIFGHRNMRRVNWLGVSRCRLIKVDGLDLHVEELDAVDGPPVLDMRSSAEPHGSGRAGQLSNAQSEWLNLAAKLCRYFSRCACVVLGQLVDEAYALKGDMQTRQWYEVKHRHVG